MEKKKKKTSKLRRIKFTELIAVRKKCQLVQTSYIEPIKFSVFAM